MSLGRAIKYAHNNHTFSRQCKRHVYTEEIKKPQFSFNQKKKPLTKSTDRQQWKKKKINGIEYAVLNYMKNSVGWKVFEKHKKSHHSSAATYSLYI